MIQKKQKYGRTPETNPFALLINGNHAYGAQIFDLLIVFQKFVAFLAGVQAQIKIDLKMFLFGFIQINS